ncbi:ABC transporter ATP-binding protein [Jeotgalibaca ciconiae]|uniref:ABC transporter ATP-binding protein n=1 Tax=Jeotgalibaca ciconiae TaxID=2496265 RepID=A0A3S9HCS5_9LACT|nr:ABC transporter ATP-binding protein [Jeotgalibaca ciconiae]AZP05159.1 ABC transporter ATP-binding protein [Jeotgalibaca ciconiae]HJB23486.1 ABC transporter ATP-binding protein/permease [Candidatus Jeotgalibaca pullicola]
MKQEKKLNDLLHVWQYIRKYKIQFFGSIILTVSMTILNVLEPFVLGLAITELGNNVADMIRDVPGAGINYLYLRNILIIYFIRAIAYQLSNLFSQRLMTKVVQMSMRDLRRDLDAKINRLPVSFFDSQSFGDVLSRVTNDVDSISNALQQSLLQVVNAILGITFAIIMLLFISWKLTIVAIIMIPAAYLISKKITQMSQPYFRQQAKYLGELNGFVQENLTGFSVIKLYGKEDDSVKEFQRINGSLQKSGFKAAFVSGLMTPFTALISNGAYILVAVLGILEVFAGTMTIGNVQAVAQYVWQINQPISTITQLSAIIQSAAAATQRIFGFLDEEELVEEKTSELPSLIKGDISFENVSFSYSEDQTLIKNFNVDVKSGDTVAIVGPTGAGKTTMINLLMRFYDVDSGAITLDGHDIRTFSRQDYRSQFGMVLQDAWLYQDTIQENIRFGNLGASDEDVISAAEAANVHHFIQTLGEGYQTVINQEASNVSLGQKQLLTIARTFIADPKVLILDEATSSVDTRLEALIQKAMAKIMKGRTSFVIAHRLSTIRDADLILVMDQGEIIEQGTHDDLMAQGGFYSNLYNSQFQEE